MRAYNWQERREEEASGEGCCSASGGKRGTSAENNGIRGRRREVETGMEKVLSGDYRRCSRTLHMPDTLKELCVAGSSRNIHLSTEFPSFLRSPRPPPLRGQKRLCRTELEISEHSAATQDHRPPSSLPPSTRSKRIHAASSPANSTWTSTRMRPVTS